MGRPRDRYLQVYLGHAGCSDCNEPPDFDFITKREAMQSEIHDGVRFSVGVVVPVAR